MKFSHCLAAALFSAVPVAQAQMSPDRKMPMPTKPAASAAAMVMTAGVVQGIDATQGVVTLKHGDITNMQMPAMTMAFGVADKKMLNNVKVGDKVKFHVETVNNAPTVTHIEPAR